MKHRSDLRNSVWSSPWMTSAKCLNHIMHMTIHLKYDLNTISDLQIDFAHLTRINRTHDAIFWHITYKFTELINE